MNELKCGDCSFFEPIGQGLAVCVFGITRRSVTVNDIIEDCKDAKPFKGIRYEYEDRK